MDNLEICKKTRKIAADTLAIVLKQTLESIKPISDIDLRDSWLKELRKHSELFPDGWYIPPPYGLGVLFATDINPSRLNYKSLRPKDNWPTDDITLDTQRGLAYFFAGFVDKNNAIIGDFGISIYFGKDKKIRNYLKTCLTLNKDIFHYTNVDMKLADVVKFANEQMQKRGLKNEIYSLSDPAGTNIGHTIPFVLESMSNLEKNILQNAGEDWEAVCRLISKKRIYLNSTEQTKITSGMAITIEPRPSLIDEPELPTSLSFHTIAIFGKNNRKELLTNFNQIFKLVGMDYMI